MLKSKTSTAESFIALGGIIVGFTTCFIAGAPIGWFLFGGEGRFEHLMKHFAVREGAFEHAACGRCSAKMRVAASP